MAQAVGQGAGLRQLDALFGDRVAVPGAAGESIVCGLDDGCHFTAWGKCRLRPRLATVAKKPRRLLTRPAPRRAAMIRLIGAAR